MNYNMFSVIGIVISMYVGTRMVELIDERTAARKSYGFIGVCAALTLMAAAGAFLYFIFGSLPDLGSLSI